LDAKLTVKAFSVPSKMTVGVANCHRQRLPLVSQKPQLQTGNRISA